MQIPLQPSSSDFELLVDFDYQPFERAETGPDARYPGCPASVEIEHVTLNGHEITSLLTEAQLQSLERDVWDYLDNLQPDYDLPYDLL